MLRFWWDWKYLYARDGDSRVLDFAHESGDFGRRFEDLVHAQGLECFFDGRRAGDIGEEERSAGGGSDAAQTIFRAAIFQLFLDVGDIHEAFAALDGLAGHQKREISKKKNIWRALKT